MFQLLHVCFNTFDLLFIYLNLRMTRQSPDLEHNHINSDRRPGLHTKRTAEYSAQFLCCDDGDPAEQFWVIIKTERNPNTIRTINLTRTRTTNSAQTTNSARRGKLQISTQQTFQRSARTQDTTRNRWLQLFFRLEREVFKSADERESDIDCCTVRSTRWLKNTQFSVYYRSQRNWLPEIFFYRFDFSCSTKEERKQ